MKTVSTNKELADALKSDEQYIKVTGELTIKVKKIKRVRNAAWVVAAGALATSIALAIATPAATVVTAPAGGFGGAIPFTGSALAGGTAAIIIGGAAKAALVLGIAAGGIGTVNKMRNNYTIQQTGEGYIILKKH